MSNIYFTVDEHHWAAEETPKGKQFPCLLNKLTICSVF